MASTLTLDRVRSDIDVLARAGLDRSAFMAEVHESIRRAVPHVAACMATVDPATRLLTSTTKFGDLAGNDDHDHLWGVLEYGFDDPTTFSGLVDRPGAAVGMHLETAGDVNRSPRMRELLTTHFDYADELRMVGRHGQQSWGGMSLFRGAGEQPFTEAEVAFVGSLSADFAAGLRAGLLVRLVTGSDVHADIGPTVLIVGPDDRLKQVSAGAEALLDALAGDPNVSDASGMIASLVSAARRFAAGASDVVPRARVRLPSGRWLVMHASPLTGVNGEVGDVVITIEEARPPEIVPLVVAAFQLTVRERDVTQLVLQGVDTKDIAATLNLSRYTVQDHLKSVFDKAGVRSRRELVARVYFDQYVPRMGNDLAPSGWFAVPPSGDPTLSPI